MKNKLIFQFTTYKCYTSIIFLLSILIILFLNSCSKDDSNPNQSQKIETEEFILQTNASIGTNGGTIFVNGGILDGMSIEIPNGGVSKNTDFSISTAIIKNHTYGLDFNPVTPLIRINNGGEYADSVMTVTIPCIVPKNHFAMGFYYNEETGELEGIPVVAINDSNVVLATRHFSGKNLIDISGGQLNHRSTTWADILVASVQTAKLFELQESGFRPAIDDWEFTNYGSYIVPNGHCTGQAVTAMWYYATQKPNNNLPLFNRFSKFPGMWQDNRNGYRFASVVQKDKTVAKAKAWMANFDAIGTKRFSKDSLHFLSFAYAIHLTKKPQLIEVWRVGGGHAMIVYKTQNNILSIADPNFPGSYSHVISLGSNGFLPYESKSSANDTTPKIYTNITYIAKSALFSFENISKRYDEMQRNIIGNEPPNEFPGITLKWYNGKEWLDAEDTIYTSQDSITFCAVCNSCDYAYPGSLTDIILLDPLGKVLSINDGKGYLKLKLNSNENLLPIYIKGESNALPGKSRYIDFKLPLVIKEKTVQFEYWLKGYNAKGEPEGHFGAKDVEPIPGGKWIGNNFDLNYQITENGITGVVSMNLKFSPTKDNLISYNVEYYVLDGSKQTSIISLDGVNLGLSSSSSDYFEYYSQGSGPCASLTRVDFTIWGGVASWGCDDESFIRFSIPKP